MRSPVEWEVPGNRKSPDMSPEMRPSLDPRADPLSFCMRRRDPREAGGISRSQLQ
jgi:hypothetical protein